jgi:hypothetical protein
MGWGFSLGMMPSIMPEYIGTKGGLSSPVQSLLPLLDGCSRHGTNSRGGSTTTSSDLLTSGGVTLVVKSRVWSGAKRHRHLRIQ